ncbi:hypothetical protein [Catenulispora pinisilvae]|uniref:hypothetical protein n=1 Tax=Catenulispora pinisilvae TaxID=2705253 RepID=UPI001892521A|nr:hypothetical protein [Catenulispora pinisilvae]
MVMVEMNDRARWRFTLDVSRGDFGHLKDASLKEVINLAYAFFATFPRLELDSDQQARWDQFMLGAQDSSSGDDHSR